MDVRSPGWRTQLAIARLAGAEVRDAGTHVVVRHPLEPTYHWGNHLLLPDEPASGDAGRWLGAFAAAFPAADHVAIGIDGAGVDTSGYRDGGLEVGLEVVLTAARLRPPPAPLPTGATIRLLRSEGDWAEHLALRTAVAGATAAWRRFHAEHQRSARQLVATGAGRWWGLWAEGRLRSTLGTVADGAGATRYQEVVTDPAWRRRGGAGWLVHTAGTAALRSGSRRLVIVAEPDGPAVGLYRRLGLADAGSILSIERPDRGLEQLVVR